MDEREIRERVEDVRTGRLSRRAFVERMVAFGRNEEYDRAYRAADSELDPVKRAALFVQMNDLVIQDVVVIPVLWRNGVSASGARLRGMDLSGWDSTLWRLAYWHKSS